MSRESVSLLEENSALTDEQRKAFTNPPLSIRIPAFLFIAFGAATCIRIGLDLFFGSGFKFNLWFLGIFIGRGLLRFRNGWRELAIVVTLFPTAGVLSFPVVMALRAFEGNTLPIRRPSFHEVITFAIILAYSIWQLRSLMNAKYASLCKVVSADRNPVALQLIKSRKFSLSSMLLSMMALSIVFALLSDHLRDGLTQHSSGVHFVSTATGLVQLGFRQATNRVLSTDHVDIVITHSAKGEHSSAGVRWEGLKQRNREFSWNGTTYYFPPGSSLCEIVDGTASFYTLEINRNDLEMFCQNVSPTNWTAASLIDFVNTRHDDDN